MSVALGVLGMFLPVLPTTPFLLLAAVCFSRSSELMYRWLTGNRWFGHYIRDYREGRGVPLHAKVVALSSLWITVGYTTGFVIPLLWVKALVLAIAAAVTVHIVRLKPAAPEIGPNDVAARPARIPRYSED